MRQVKYATLTILVILSGAMVACSAKVSDVISDTPPRANEGFYDSKPTIQGPKVQGHWQSACNRKPGSSTYRKFDIVFSKGTVERLEKVYADIACATPGTAIIKSQGRFRFIEKYTNGSYNIEYAFDEGSGITSYPQEKLAIDGDRLFISNYAVGDLATVLESEPLFLISAAF